MFDRYEIPYSQFPTQNDDSHAYQYRPLLKPSKISPAKLDLNNEMRSLWEQHVFWTRLLIVSIIEGLHDEEAVTKRLMQNPSDIAKLFGRYYGGEVAKKLTALLTEHLAIGAQLIHALKTNNPVAAQELDRRWYVNADEMASAFNAINPFFAKEMMRKMLYQHLDLTKQEVAYRLAKNYQADISEFDKIEQQALGMADHFTKGITKHFPRLFQ